MNGDPEVLGAAARDDPLPAIRAFLVAVAADPGVRGQTARDLYQRLDVARDSRPVGEGLDPEYAERLALADQFVAGLAAGANLPPDAATVGRIIDEHYRARRDADPKGPPVHECGSYCGADIAARLASDGVSRARPMTDLHDAILALPNPYTRTDPRGDAWATGVIAAANEARRLQAGPAAVRPATEDVPCVFPTGAGELPYYCETHGHIRDQLTDERCRVSRAAVRPVEREGVNAQTFPGTVPGTCLSHRVYDCPQCHPRTLPR